MLNLLTALAGEPQKAETPMLDELLKRYRMGTVKIKRDQGIIGKNPDFEKPEDPVYVGIQNVADSIYSVKLYAVRRADKSSYFVSEMEFIEKTTKN